MYSAMSWQKPARIAVALVGLASAVAVYAMMGERRVSTPPAPIPTKDQKAIVEIEGSRLENFPGLKKNFEIDGDIRVYEDGTKKLVGDPARIIVHKAGNRTFTITGKEAQIGKDENQFEFIGEPVRLEDSDGFWLETDRATADLITSISHVPGAATFGKGRMRGSGVGFSYDNMKEILLISKQARVKTVDERGKVVTDLASSYAMLDRLQHVLTLDTGVHVLREDQIIDTDHATGYLSSTNDIVTKVELFGNSRVAGGPAIESMNARDITLDYTDDGKILETAKLAGTSSIAMKGEGEAPGLGIKGETVDLALAADGMLTSAVARQNVRLDLPASAESPSRIITAQTLDGTGEPGRGLTRATFEQDVMFEEGMRRARSQKLVASLADDAVTAATFSTDVTFEETGLKACSAEAEYRPDKGTLKLSGATKAGPPMVGEEEVAIEAETIDVALDTRKMAARSGRQLALVTTFMRHSGAQRCRPSTKRAASEQGAKNVPGLLKSDTPVTIVAPSLDYDSEKGYAEYTGRAGGRVTLVQESPKNSTQDSTQISSDRMVVDQTKGDLTATGTVKSSMLLDNKVTRGEAHEMRYVDDKRRLTYTSQPRAQASQVTLLSAPRSVMRAGTVDIMLAAQENTLESMRAVGSVSLSEDPQYVTGGTRLDYTAADERFVVTGDGTRPVTAVTREDDACRQFLGKVVKFQKGKTAIEVDGRQQGNATLVPMKDGTCAPATPR